jgi:hypothetical protein
VHKTVAWARKRAEPVAAFRARVLGMAEFYDFPYVLFFPKTAPGHPAMIFPVNKRFVLSTTGTPVRTLTITALPAPPGPAVGQGPYGPTQDQVLTISDTNNLSTPGSPVWTAGLTALQVLWQQPIPLNTTTTNGLAVTSIPPGVGIAIDFG